MKKIILISLGVFVLLIGGLSLYMSLLDWNEHKGRISMQFSSVVGENIEFGGDLKVSLFPHPKMSAKSVSVVNPQTGEILATVKQLSMAVTLSSVLRGTPDVQSLTVDGVELWIKFDENGKSNWTRQVEAQQSALNDVRVQVLYIKDGVVHVQDQAYGWAVDLTDFAAEVQAETLVSGPYQIAGNFIYESERYGMALSIDSMLQLDDVGFHIRLRHPDTDGKFMYDGVYNKQTANIKGSFSGELTQTAETVNKFLQKDILNTKYNVPMQFSAKEFNLEGEIAHVSGLTIKMDPYFVGTGDLSFSRRFVGEQPKTFDLKYQIVDMDVRSAMDLLKEKFSQYAQEVYLPDNAWSGTFEISAGRLRISDNDAGFLANVGVKGSWNHNILNIDDFFADGQGEVDLTASGTLAPQNDLPQATMVLALKGEDIKTFFKTLNVDLQAPISNAYQKAQLNAEIKLNPKELLIENMHLKLDNADFSGKISAQLLQKKCFFDVDVNNLNFDTYIFPLDREKFPDIFSVLRHDAKALSALNDYSTDIRAHVLNATFRGVPIKEALLVASYENAELTVERLVMQEFMDSNIDGAGVFKKIDAEMPEIDALSLSIQSQDFDRLADRFEIPLPKWKLFGQKNISVSAAISGNYNEIQAKTELVSEGDVLAYDGLLTRKDGHFLFDGLLDIKTPKLENLLSKINVGIKDSKVLRGVFNASSRIKGTADKYELNDANIKIGAAQYSANLKVDKGNEKYFLNGDVKASELNFAQILSAQKVAARNTSLKMENTFFARPNFGKATFDFAPYNKIDFDLKLSADKGFYESFSLSDFSAQVVNSAQQLNIKDAAFKIGVTDVQGSAVIEYAETPRINGNISIKNLPIKKIGGSVYALSAGNINLTGNFDGNMESLEDLFGSLSGKLTMKTQDIVIYGIDLAKIEEDLKVREYSKGLFQIVQKNLQGGSTKFDPLQVNVPLQNGVITLYRITLQNSNETMDLKGNVNLQDWRINADAKIKYKKLLNVDPYGFSLTGALNSPALDISIEDIVRKYDEHWQQVAATEQARKNEADRIRNASMNQAQTEVATVAEKHTAAVALIDKYNGKNLAPDTTQLYVEQSRRLDEIGRIIQNMQNKANQPNYTEQDITEIKQQAAALRPELESIGQKINEYFADDLQQAMVDVNDKVVQLQNRYDSIYDEYKQMLSDDKKQLTLLGAEQYMTDNPTLQQYKTQMESYHSSVLKEIREFNAKLETTKKMYAGSDKLASIHALSAIPVSLEAKYKQMQDIHSATADLLLDIINQRQEIYRQEQAEKKKKRLKEAAENAGNLLIENDAELSEKSDDGADDVRESADSTVEKPEAGTEGIVKNVVSPADYRTLLPIEDKQKVPAKGEILIRATDKNRIYITPEMPSKLLTPIEGEKTAPTSGYIIVR